MKVVVNGKSMEFEKQTSILDVLEGKGLEPGNVVVEHNYEILQREEYEKAFLKEGDNVEILKFVGGG